MYSVELVAMMIMPRLSIRACCCGVSNSQMIVISQVRHVHQNRHFALVGPSPGTFVFWSEAS